MKNICLAVIPARAGSKGIKQKNLREIGGRSLVGRAVSIASSIDEIDVVLCSTDSHEIAMEAERFGAIVPFYRPDHLSGDYVSDFDVITNAVRDYENYIKTETVKSIVVLQPTSPLRRIPEVREAIRLLDRGFGAVWSISPADLKYHPAKQLVCKAGSLEYFDREKGPEIVARQQLAETYVRNGVVYAYNRDVLFNEGWLPENVYPLVLDPRVSIDDKQDLYLAASRILKEKFDGL